MSIPSLQRAAITLASYIFFFNITEDSLKSFWMAFLAGFIYSFAIKFFEKRILISSKAEKRFSEKLDRYEAKAYELGSGEDWFKNIGKGFASYVKDCASSGTTASISGFEDYLDFLYENRKV